MYFTKEGRGGLSLGFISKQSLLTAMTQVEYSSRQTEVDFS